MKKISIIIILISIFAVGYMWWPGLMSQYHSLNDNTPQGKLMSVESYVSQNISELSPIKEVLGGKFYVTDIEVLDGRGTVSYEDGHIAYTADFSYTSSDRTGHNITSFVIRN
ncbi:MAG TPA: hypothetical protein PLD99_02595 [Parcubacteria group bacterium]|nr:hypothetical protein [Parcubacteria group bacterium]